MAPSQVYSDKKESAPLVAAPQISSADIVRFAEEHINLKREDLTAYREQVKILREKLEKYIADHPEYGLVKILESGSVAKGSALKTLNDLDLAAYIQADKIPSDETEFLNWLADQLRDAYPQMSREQITPQTHTVRISYRGSGLDVEVVPVHYQGAPDDRGYLVDRYTGKRVLTSISLHIEFMRKRKEAQPDGHFSQMARFAKWWIYIKVSENSSFRFKSFMAELILAHLSDEGLDMSDYPSALKKFFSYLVTTGLKNRIAFSVYYPASKLPGKTDAVIEIFDPVNPENNVADDYSEADRQLIVDAAQDALDSLVWAGRASTKGKAVECWQEVLGPTFRG